MIVVDTNVLVRLATNDSPIERAAAVDLFEHEGVRVLKTVLLETEWVLRSRYGLSNRQVLDFVLYLIRLPSVTVEDEEWVRWAIGAVENGLEFADALHVAQAAALGERFQTFDQGLIRRATRLKDVDVQLLTRSRRP
jgi:predicted nucleic acid-binding protein